MAQAKKKIATKTAKKSACGCAKKTRCKKCEKRQGTQDSNMFFVVSMSILAATLLFADLLLLNA